MFNSYYLLKLDEKTKAFLSVVKTVRSYSHASLAHSKDFKKSVRTVTGLSHTCPLQNHTYYLHFSMLQIEQIRYYVSIYEL